MSFRQFRIAVLIGLLALAGGVTAYDQHIARGWQAPLRVEIRPLAGDTRARTAAHLASLRPADFADIDAFLSREARRYGFVAEPALDWVLRAPATGLPPAPPASQNGFAVALWSLKLRLWSYLDSDAVLPRPGVVRLYVIYHSPEQNLRLAHSLGLQKGLIGVVHAWALPQAQGYTQFVVAHELLHTLGASDKYDPATRLPRFPDGYVEPERTPRYPQTLAEIMAGQIPLAATRAEMPSSLTLARIGAQTAREIGFDQAFARHWERP